MLSRTTPRQVNERYHRRSALPNSSKRKHPPIKSNKGVFADGIWHCDCKQRLPAERFKVKKEGITKGKWFYTCQMSNKDATGSSGCGFFLWEEDAKVREEAAVLGNSRSEPSSIAQKRRAEPRQVTFEDMAAERSFVMGGEGRKVQDGHDDGAETDSSEEAFSSPLKAKVDSLNASTKRTARTAGFDSASYNNESTSMDDANPSMRAPETPRKAPKMNTGYVTPADTIDAQRTALIEDDFDEPLPSLHLTSKATVDHTLPTPTTPRVSSNADMAKPIPYPTSNTDKVKPASQLTSTIATPISARDLATPTKQISNPMDAVATPHANRHFDAAANADISNSSLVNEVMAELVGVNIPPATEQKLCTILSSYELKAKGVFMGRATTREALKKSKQHITELQATIARQQMELDAAKNAALHTRMQSHSETKRSTLGQTLRS